MSGRFFLDLLVSEGCLLLELERPIHVSITLDSGVPGVNILQNFPKNIVEKFPHIVKDWGRELVNLKGFTLCRV